MKRKHKIATEQIKDILHQCCGSKIYYRIKQ